MFILIHPETYFVRIAPPLNCGGTPTMSNCTCFYSHNVAVVRAYIHANTYFIYSLSCIDHGALNDLKS